MPKDFARSQLEKYGWKNGDGLGRDKSGFTEPVKASLKFDKNGLGFSTHSNEEFFWWDHVYNKTLSNLDVKKHDGDTENEKKDKTTVDPLNEKINGNLLYRNFKKAEITNLDEEKKCDKLVNFSDEKLFKLCGGLTGHKAARHGLTMKGKMKRIQDQESSHQKKLKSSGANSR